MVPGPLGAVVVELRTAETEAGFRQMLTQLARTGLTVGASIGALAVLLLLGIFGLYVLLGPPTGYGDLGVSLWDTPILFVICLIALTSARHLSLRGARVLTGSLVIVAALTSVVDDVVVGSSTLSPFIAFTYLLAVVSVPFRPVQTLALGAALGAVLWLGIEVFPPLLGGASVGNVVGHYAYLTIITAVLMGVSGLLYVTRYWQYRAQHKAEELSERVQAVEAAKSRFFTNLSHEVRTPLTLLLGPLEDALAERFGPLEPRLQRRVEEMHAQALRLYDLISQLLDVSKLEAEAMPLRVREHDFAAFALLQLEPFCAAAERQGITLQAEQPAVPLLVWFDEEKMTRVIANLLSNALKHTPAGGTIRVRVTASDGLACLSVRDSGEGLTQEALATVFDRFASGERAPAGHASTGIGLALVNEIVERHGGHAEATSEPGFGAEFVVHLPLGDAHVAAEDRVDSEPDPEPSTEPRAPELHPQRNGHPPAAAAAEAAELDPPADAPLVLVADDNAAVRLYLRDLLGGTYRVIEAADGAEAWDLVRERRPALVISDVMMPTLDGFALCRRIRADESLAATPVVLVTARAEEEARLEGWRTGADAYLPKPFSGEELHAVTEHLIEVRRTLRERVKVPDWMEAKAATVPSPEAAFLDRVQGVVGEHIGDSGFGVEWLAAEVGLSARQLQRRLKKLTRLTAAGFIRAMRLEHAARLLREHDVQVQEVACAVGYEDTDHFSKLFRQAYGVPPSEYTNRSP